MVIMFATQPGTGGILKVRDSGSHFGDLFRIIRSTAGNAYVTCCKMRPNRSAACLRYNGIYLPVPMKALNADVEPR